ncbi:tyrosine-type recombinase/integrase [Streptosporangium canum]|uniref:tyrosine-type recombinase/integrase n=1 Tax=Streptosporangium canum TaxID=324952 RepID=UPI0037969B3D
MSQNELVSMIDNALVIPSADEMQARLEALDEAAAQHDTRNANTKRGYEDDWKVWQTYTAELRIPTLAATTGSFTGFVLWLVQKGMAPNTIDRRVTGATVMLREHGVTIPQAASDRARETLDAYKRNLAETGEQRGRGQARAVSIRDLRAMSAALPDTLAGIRDRAILLVGFGMAARRSELANLLGRDVVLHTEGLTVDIRFGKTKPRTSPIPHGSNPLTCPVRAWRAWSESVTIDPDGPAFRRIDRHGNVLGKMAAQSIGDRVAAAAVGAGLPATTAHGLRAGLATEARRAGHDAKTIALQGGWSPTSSALYEYMRIADQWSDNAVAGIGL